MKTYKLYQILFEDEWNNLYPVGWYVDLDDAIDDVNGYLLGEHKLEKGDLVECMSTFGYMVYQYLDDIFSERDANYEVNEEYCNQAVRGFIHYFTEEEFEVAKKMFVKEKKQDESI